MAAWLVSVKLACEKKATRLSLSWSAENVMKIFNMATDITKSFEYLLATGNLSSKSGMADEDTQVREEDTAVVTVVALAMHRSGHAAVHGPLCGRRQAQLHPLPVPLPLCAQRGSLRQNEDHVCAQAAARVLGLPVSCPHP